MIRGVELWARWCKPDLWVSRGGYNLSLNHFANDSINHTYEMNLKLEFPFWLTIFCTYFYESTCWENDTFWLQKREDMEASRLHPPRPLMWSHRPLYLSLLFTVLDLYPYCYNKIIIISIAHWVNGIWMVGRKSRICSQLLRSTDSLRSPKLAAGSWSEGSLVGICTLSLWNLH